MHYSTVKIIQSNPTNNDGLIITWSYEDDQEKRYILAALDEAAEVVAEVELADLDTLDEYIMDYMKWMKERVTNHDLEPPHPFRYRDILTDARIHVAHSVTVGHNEMFLVEITEFEVFGYSLGNFAMRVYQGDILLAQKSANNLVQAYNMLTDEVEALELYASVVKRDEDRKIRLAKEAEDRRQAKLQAELERELTYSQIATYGEF